MAYPPTFWCGGWRMRSMLWSYFGRRRFSQEMSAFEVGRFFSLSTDDRHVLRRRFCARSRLDAAGCGWVRLGAALQLGFVRTTGTTLDAIDYVPHAVLERVGHQLGMSLPESTTLSALYRRQDTCHIIFRGPYRIPVERCADIRTHNPMVTAIDGRSQIDSGLLFAAGSVQKILFWFHPSI